MERRLERQGHLDLPPLPHRTYPKVLQSCLIASSIAHDVLLLTAAGFSAVATPATVAQSLGAFDMVWISMVFAGGLLGIAGTILRKAAIDITGCVLMASGKITWALALASSGVDVPSTYAAAAIFTAGAFGTLWRLFAVLVGVFLRARD